MSDDALKKVGQYLERFASERDLALPPLGPDGVARIQRGSAVVSLHVLTDQGVILFLARVAAAPLERWSGPVAGTFGAHVVRREPARAPQDIATSDAVAVRVARDWAHDRHADDLRRAIDQLVASRRVVVREVHAIGEVAP